MNYDYHVYSELAKQKIKELQAQAYGENKITQSKKPLKLFYMKQK